MQEIHPVTIRSSKWGSVQQQYKFADGIDFVATAGHGGFKLNAKMEGKIPAIFRTPDRWYEEDCEAGIIMYFHSEVFNDPDAKTKGEETLKQWYWREWEVYTGTVLKAGESKRKDTDLWEERHKNDYVVRSAYGDWHERVPKDFVGVYATKGKDEKWFLVPHVEYKTPFAVDPLRHQEIAPLNEKSKRVA